MEKSKKPKTKVYASCEHEYVSYKDLHRLCSKQHTYIKNQDKVLNVLKDRLREYHEKHSDCLEKNQELLQASKSWDIKYKQRVSVTSSDSIKIKINKLKKK